MVQPTLFVIIYQFYVRRDYRDFGSLTVSFFQGEDGSGAAVISGGGGGFEFGVDPNEDPELALALRVSMEENRARQAREEAAAGGGAAAGGAAIASATAGT